MPAAETKGKKKTESLIEEVPTPENDPTGTVILRK
jgi:hypothetical protein